MPSSVDEVLGELLQDLGIDPQDPKARLIISEVQTLSGYRGPIPPPQMLAEYDAIKPGFAERIIDGWDEQRSHRHELELAIFKSGERRRDRSQLSALIVGLCGLVAATLVGIWGSGLASSIIAIVAVGGPNAATILSRYLPSTRDRN